MDHDNHERGTTRLLVTQRHRGRRLDQFVAAVTGTSRRRVRDMVAAGRIARNGSVTRVQSRVLVAGDVVDVLCPATELGLEAAPQPPSVRLLHVDDWLAVADKPSGVLSHAVPGHDPDDIPFDQLVLLALASRRGRRPFLRLVHRLDRLTSGAVLFACNPAALRPLTRAWREGTVDRTYLAVVEGDPGFETLELDGPIARDPDHRWRFRVDATGKQALTSVRVVTRASVEDRPYAVVVCKILTGRTHQVRVHLADAGHPVLGDLLYGARRFAAAQRPLIHATTLDLPHPHTGKTLHISSTPPPDFDAFLEP